MKEKEIDTLVTSLANARVVHLLSVCRAMTTMVADETTETATLNFAYNQVTFNEKLAITKENLCTKYTPFTYKYIALNEKLPITNQNLHIFFSL